MVFDPFHQYRETVIGRPNHWRAEARTRGGSPLYICAESPASLVRLLRDDPWCQCVERVIGIAEVVNENAACGEHAA